MAVTLKQLKRPGKEAAPKVIQSGRSNWKLSQGYAILNLSRATDSGSRFAMRPRESVAPRASSCTIEQGRAGMAELADAADSKSSKTQSVTQLSY